MTQIDDILPVDQRQFFGNFALSCLRIERHRQSIDSTVSLNSRIEPLAAGGFSVRRMFLARDGVLIAAEWQTEKIAPQGNEHWNRHRRRWLILPGRDVIRLHGLRRVAIEHDRGEVSPHLRHRQFDLRSRQNDARLRMHRALGRFGSQCRSLYSSARLRSNPNRRVSTDSHRTFIPVDLFGFQSVHAPNCRHLAVAKRRPILKLR